MNENRILTFEEAMEIGLENLPRDSETGIILGIEL